MKVVWSPLAVQRAVEQATYIARDKPAAAEGWLDGLFDAVTPLARFPKMGRVVPELANPALRELDYRGHRVIYRLEPKQVSILTVRHGKRLFDFSEIRPKLSE